MGWPAPAREMNSARVMTGAGFNNIFLIIPLFVELSREGFK